MEDSKIIPIIKFNSGDKSQVISKLPDIPSVPSNPSFNVNPALQKILTGKQLLVGDLPFSLEEIHQHYENGYIVYRRGLEISDTKLKCERCGSTDPASFAEFPCSRCGETDVYCRRCLMMGRVSGCTPLISWKGPNPESTVHSSLLNWDGQLSEGQKLASNRVVEAVENLSELLVWAVAGAGKTEVLFAGIERALSTGKRVCLATPRTDVVLELAPRLGKVFPQVKIASLYGGSDDRHEYAQLTIATTHQLLRFYQAFDVIIVDEVDAFPYSVDETLQYVVEQSRKLQSTLIYLTATPSQKWQRECRLGKREYVTIPARFHRKPLPVPRFEWSGNWEKKLSKGKLSVNITKWIEARLASGKPTLVFVPKISYMEKILFLLRQLHPQIESVHAEDPERKEKVLKMRQKEIPILVTTTILERGVTISNIDVAVIGSEDRIFTESALVQIAGRAGRSTQFPTGDVIFFHYGKTEAMVNARNQIVKMNKEGIKKGLIDV
ncbi:DEAD/DEAH box helicase [Mesobacillus jeotgali]|uniref:DEAD/DEAH box helicase n=2 Tax=Mesobacillus jeotgali TaxID=129985 RepID=A0ABY9VN86_9BACI|nr:DEAD/DEAH box helicase [Mesobacillus jeotgali]WNF25288.1 DEAD/DEAH box helicase [Mesobacillus jeotgali]